LAGLGEGASQGRPEQRFVMSQSAPRPASIRRNAVLAFGAQISTGVFTAVLTLYLVRKLGPDGYGIFAVALSIGALAVLPSDLGLSQSMARFLAERRGDRGAMARILADTLHLKLLAAAVVGGLLFALASPIASIYGIPDLTWPLRAMAFAVIAQSMLGLFRSAFEAIGRMGTDWQLVAGESFVEASASIALVALGGGAAGAVWGRAIGFGFGALLGLVLAMRLFGFGMVRPQPDEPATGRRLLGYGIALFVIDGVYTAFAEIDTLLVGAILGASAAGILGAPMRLIPLMVYPAAAITAGVAPRMAKGEHEGPNVAALEMGLRLLVLVYLLMVTPLLVWAGPLVHLVFGPEYGEAADVLRALAPFMLLIGPARLLTISVNYLGEARRRIVIVLAALVVNIAVDLVLISRVGVVGAAIGNDIAFAVYAFGHLYVCRRITRIPLKPLAGTLARGFAAAAAMAAVLLAFGRESVATPLIVAGLIVGTAVFLGGVLVLREPVPEELSASARGLARRWLRRRAAPGA
jgi:O-antigen/teichoic acid export membrane protein